MEFPSPGSDCLPLLTPMILGVISSIPSLENGNQEGWERNGGMDRGREGGKETGPSNPVLFSSPPVERNGFIATVAQYLLDTRSTEDLQLLLMGDEAWKQLAAGLDLSRSAPWGMLAMPEPRPGWLFPGRNSLPRHTKELPFSSNISSMLFLSGNSLWLRGSGGPCRGQDCFFHCCSLEEKMR